MRHSIGIDTIERFYRRRAGVALSRIAHGMWDAPAVIGLWLWYRFLVLQRRADERRQLANMTDAQLEDMGITRQQADAEALKPLWKL
jgi:uncharacterized protein YjiS (DUF1127 family)